MATINSLAPEMLCRIFELAALSHDHRASLLSATLVCRRWRDAAERALFEILTVYAGQGESGERWLASEARGRYRVRDAVLMMKDLDDLSPWFEALHGVERVRVDGAAIRWMDWEGLTKDGWKVEGMKDPSSALMRIRSLELTIWHWLFDYHRPPSFPFQLERLEIRGATNCPPSAEFLTELFRSSATSLTSLVFNMYRWSENPYASLLPVLPIVGANLLHLGIHLSSFDGAGPAHSHTLSTLLSSCTHLKTLSITFRAYAPFSDESEEWVAALVGEDLADLAAGLPLPPTLTALSIQSFLSDNNPSEIWGTPTETLHAAVLEALDAFVALPTLANVVRVDFPSLELRGMEDSKAGAGLLDNWGERGISVYGREELW